MQTLKLLVIAGLRGLLDKLEKSCGITGDGVMCIIENMTHVPIGKEAACSYLGISEKDFDSKVTDGLIPKGRKRVCFKKPVWYLDELDQYKTT